MSTPFKFTQPPQLFRRPFCADGDRWELSYYPENRNTAEIESYTLQIRYFWDGETWNHFRLYRGDASVGQVHLMSRQEHDSRMSGIIDNENEDAAREWFETSRDNVQIERGIEIDIRAALIRRWEALCELITLAVTM